MLKWLKTVLSGGPGLRVSSAISSVSNSVALVGVGLRVGVHRKNRYTRFKYEISISLVTVVDITSFPSVQLLLWLCLFVDVVSSSFFGEDSEVSDGEVVAQVSVHVQGTSARPRPLQIMHRIACTSMSSAKSQ